MYDSAALVYGAFVSSWFYSHTLPATAGCPTLRFLKGGIPSRPSSWHLPRRDFVQSRQRVRIAAHQQQQSRRLWIRRGAPLFSFLQRSFANARPQRENRTGATESLARIADEFRVDVGNGLPCFAARVPQGLKPSLLLLHRHG